MGFLDSLYDPTQYGSRFAPVPPDPTPEDATVPAYTPTHAALSALLGFQSQRPSYLTRLGLAGGNPFGESIQNERGPEHRGANTVRQLLRGLLAGINTQALGQGKDYALKLSALEAGAKDENAANTLGSLTDYRQTLGAAATKRADTGATRAAAYGTHLANEDKLAPMTLKEREDWHAKLFGLGNDRNAIAGENARTAKGRLGETGRHNRETEKTAKDRETRQAARQPDNSPATQENKAKVSKSYAAAMAAQNAKPTRKVKQAQIDANYRRAAENYNAVKRQFDAIYGAGSADRVAAQPVHTTDSILKDLNAP